MSLPTIKAIAVGLVLSLTSSVSGFAQSQGETLADIRQELEFLYGEILTLRRDLSTTGETGIQGTSSGPALQRIDALEQEVRRLTGAVEQKQYRIQQVVKDGTNRVGDLEFRLCELEENCDIATLKRTEPLGGMVVPKTTTISTTTTVESGDQTASEQANFNQAYAAYEAGDYASAASLFESFALAFPGGPLTGEAYYWRGESLAGVSDWSNAALSFLESFSGSPAGVKAPDALYRLGISLGQLGQNEEACLMLSEVPVRYPASAVVGQANAEYGSMGCS
ncbi:MAG: tol-pal system protein YbgF [Rhodobacteraceae bacterium]|nr:tol-pal system protein YbgF [Paracoccaceae bacterium]